MRFGWDLKFFVITTALAVSGWFLLSPPQQDLLISTIPLHRKEWLPVFLGAFFGYVGSRALAAGIAGTPSHPATQSLSPWRLAGWAFCIGWAEELYFRAEIPLFLEKYLGWGWAVVAANLWYAVIILILMRFFSQGPVSNCFLNGLTLTAFGLFLSAAYAATQSLGLVAGFHIAVYFVYRRWPRAKRGLPWRTTGYWLGQEDTALGILPCGVYGATLWIATLLCRHLFR